MIEYQINERKWQHIIEIDESLGLANNIPPRLMCIFYADCSTLIILPYLLEKQ